MSNPIYENICQICRKATATHTLGFVDAEMVLCCDCVEDMLVVLLKNVNSEQIFEKGPPVVKS